MMHLFQDTDRRFVLDLGHLDEADAQLVAELLADLGRASSGDAWAALLTMARARRERGSEPGSIVLRITEGGGSPSTIDWRVSIEKTMRSLLHHGAKVFGRNRA